MHGVPVANPPISLGVMALTKGVIFLLRYFNVRNLKRYTCANARQLAVNMAIAMARTSLFNHKESLTKKARIQMDTGLFFFYVPNPSIRNCG